MSYLTFATGLTIFRSSVMRLENEQVHVLVGKFQLYM